MIEFVHVGEAVDNQQAETAEIHGLEVEIAHEERAEVVACHFVEQQARVDTVGWVGEHQQLAGIGVKLETCLAFGGYAVVR